MNVELIKKTQKIRLAVFDVDGVFTDGKLYFLPDGTEFKVFHVHDGVGIKMLNNAQITTAIITGRKSPVVALRARSLGINHVYQGREDKLTALNELLEKLELTLAQTAYLGDDLPDLPAICAVELGACPANAVAEVKKHAHLITKKEGGNGAVREFCELLINAKKHA